MGRTIRDLIAAAACVLLLSQLAGARELPPASSGVTIRNDKFEVTHVVRGQRTLHEFRAIWNAKKKVNPARFTAHWQFKIDLADGSRWLYDVRGYTQLVSVKKVPLYKVPAVRVFNKLIRADQINDDKP